MKAAGEEEEEMSKVSPVVFPSTQQSPGDENLGVEELTKKLKNGFFSSIVLG